MPFSVYLYPRAQATMDQFRSLRGLESSPTQTQPVAGWLQSKGGFEGFRSQ